MIKKAIDVKDEVVKVLERRIETASDWDDSVYCLNYILDGHFDNIYACIDKQGKILDILCVRKVYGIKSVSPYFLFGNKHTMRVLHEADRYFKKCMFSSEYFSHETASHFFDCNMQSSFCEKEYNVGGNYMVSRKKDENILRDAIERIRFGEIGELSFELITDYEDITRTLIDTNTGNGYPMWKEKYGNYSIIGFHYLNIDFQRNHMLFLAKSGKTLVGAIKIGEYQVDNKYHHYGLNFIDVNKKYRNRGIAKRMIEAFSKCIPTDLPLVLSSESDMGKQCRMEQHFKDVWQSEIYTSSEWDKKWTI